LVTFLRNKRIQMRHFKKSVILCQQSILKGEYAVMSKCDGAFVVLSQRSGRLLVKDSSKNTLFDEPTKTFFKFLIYAETIDNKVFFAFDNSLDCDFKKRYEALKRVEELDHRIVVINSIFTFSPLLFLKESLEQTFPCDGIVLVSVYDETPHYKWKPVQTVDFLIQSNGYCIVGWSSVNPLPFPWCWVEEKKDSKYIGIPFGDEKGPHRFSGDVAKVQNSVVECSYDGNGVWRFKRKRDDKTLEFQSVKSFAGANNWTTAQSALNSLQPVDK
jgi:hypothetical protein